MKEPTPVPPMDQQVSVEEMITKLTADNFALSRRNGQLEAALAERDALIDEFMSKKEKMK